MARRGRVTTRVLEAIKAELGPVDSPDVTQFGDAEPMHLILAPDCEYCGSVNPSATCRQCGAPAPGVQHPVWR